MTNIQELQRISTQVRRDIIRMVTNAKSGHPGGSMSGVELLLSEERGRSAKRKAVCGIS